MKIEKYIRKEEFVEAIKFNGKNCIDCIKFAEPNKTDEEYMKLAHIRTVHDLYGKFVCLLVGEDKIETKIGDYIVKSEISGISVVKQEFFNELFLNKDYYL